jgi:hypothetical protein
MARRELFSRQCSFSTVLFLWLGRGLPVQVGVGFSQPLRGPPSGALSLLSVPLALWQLGFPCFTYPFGKPFLTMTV